MTKHQHWHVIQQWNGEVGKECNIQSRSYAREKWKDITLYDGPGWSLNMEYRVKPDPHAEVKKLWNGKYGRDCNIQFSRLNDAHEKWTSFSMDYTAPTWGEQWHYRVDPHFEAKQAWNGKTGEQCNLEYRDTESSEWTKFITDPLWLDDLEYRVVEWVPCSFKHMDWLLGKKVVHKDVEAGLIVAVHSQDVLIGECWVTYRKLLDEYTYLDGTPCGVMV